MKKLLAVVLTLAMVLSSVSVLAAGSIDVPSDLQVSDDGVNYKDSITVNVEDLISFRTTINMEPVRAKFKEDLATKRAEINSQTLLDKQMLLDKLANCKVNGDWTLKLTYPNIVKLPEAIVNGKNMDGFNENAKLIFEETERKVEVKTSKSVLTIKIQVAGVADKDGVRPGYCTVSDMETNLDTWLGDMTFDGANVAMTVAEDCLFEGFIAGSTTISTAALSEKYEFMGIPKDSTIKSEIEAVVIVEGDGSGGTTGGTTGGRPSGPGVVSPGTSGGIGTGGGTTPGETPGTIGGGVTGLNTEDHIAYINGYEDGTVRPNDNITRAETATMIYRLLDSKTRERVFTSDNSFADVSADMWFNKAVSSMARGGYVNGYEDGNFYGDSHITRAELVAIVSRFAEGKSAEVSFTDVDPSYWGYSAIATAVANGWIEGYEDGSFKPEDAITRAESATIINRALSRGVNAAGLIDGIKSWPDNIEGEWYYYEIIEASNAHIYSGTRPAEVWSTLEVNYKYDIDYFEMP